MIKNNLAVLMAKKLTKIASVSRDTGISRSTLTEIYYGRSRGIDFATADKLCAYLNCTLNDLFEFTK